MRLSYEEYKRLYCPVDVIGDWHAFVAYESAWERQVCNPDPEPIGVVLQRLRETEARVSWLEFQISAARSALSPRFGRR